jgi:hypothetical protein
MSNDYFKSKGWLTNYAQAEDSTGMWQNYVKETEDRDARIMELVEVKRSEMDNFNTPDLDQGADSILRPGETLDDFDVTFRKPNSKGGFQRNTYNKGKLVIETAEQLASKIFKPKTELDALETTVKPSILRREASPLDLSQINSIMKNKEFEQAWKNYKISIRKVGRRKYDKDQFFEMWARENMAEGGRIGFKDGLDVSDVYNESTGHIYKKGNRFKTVYSKTPTMNQYKVNLKDPKYLDEVIKFIDKNPTLNQKEAAKIIGRKRAELVPAESYGNPGKKWNDAKAKLRNESDKAWTKKYSSISIEDRTRGDIDFNRHHAGSLREKVGTDNTMFIKAQDNYKNVRPFEKGIDEIQLKQYQTNLNRNMPIETKKEIFSNLKKQEAALRKKYPQFADYKSTLIFEETPLSKTGYMMKEEMPNPELTVSEGKTGQNIKYKDVMPSSEQGKKIIELNKKKLNLVKQLNAIVAKGGKKGKAAAQALAILTGTTVGAVADDGSEGLSGVKTAAIGGAAAGTLATKTGRKVLNNLLSAAGVPASIAFNTIYGIDLESSLDRTILGAEAALAPMVVKDAIRVTDKIKNPLLKKAAQFATTLNPKYALKAAKFLNPIGIASLAGEAIYNVGKLGYKDQKRFNALSSEEQAAERAEQEKFAFDIEGS